MSYKKLVSLLIQMLIGEDGIAVMGEEKKDLGGLEKIDLKSSGLLFRFSTDNVFWCPPVSLLAIVGQDDEQELAVVKTVCSDLLIKGESFRNIINNIIINNP